MSKKINPLFVIGFVYFFSMYGHSAPSKSNTHEYIVPVSICSIQHELIEKTAEIKINIRDILKEKIDSQDLLSRMGIRAIGEVNKKGEPIDNRVPWQYDPSPDKSGGSLCILMKGQTPCRSRRFYHIHFSENVPDNQSKPLVTVRENVQHEGQESYKITAQNAIWYYHKFGAGFASLEDKDGNDWLGYNPGDGPVSKSGSGGKYRGTPNMGHPEGYCHPGNTVSGSRIVSRGPLKVRILSESNDKKMKCQWDIFPNYARMTVLTMRTPYWFLYEGTPGGKLDMDSDYCVRPGGENGIKTLVSEKWDGDIKMKNEQGEWLYFGDGNRVLYLINHYDDNCTDSYWPMNEEMTVFGFGRLGLKKFMEKVPAQFTLGLHDGSSHLEIIKTINSAYKPVVWNMGEIIKK